MVYIHTISLLFSSKSGFPHSLSLLYPCTSSLYSQPNCCKISIWNCVWVPGATANVLVSIHCWHRMSVISCCSLTNHALFLILTTLTEAPPPYPAGSQDEDEDGWGANEFDGSDDEGGGGAAATLQFQSDNSNEHQCMYVQLLHNFPSKFWQCLLHWHSVVFFQQKPMM